MLVAMVSEHASPLAAIGGVDAGGQNVHVAALAQTVARRGAEVVVYTRRSAGGAQPRVPIAQGATVEHVDAGPACPLAKDELWPYMEQFAEGLRDAWRRERPDVVHAHFWMSGYAALAAAAPLGIPVVQTFHALGAVKRRYQGDRDTSPAERTDVERDIIARTEHVIATCTDEAFELIRLGGENQKLTVIPCGVDLELFRVQGECEPRRLRRPRLVYLGRLVERKGIGNAISALSGVHGAELIIVGGPDRAHLPDDPEARRLQALAEQSGVAERVQLRGRVEHHRIPALLRSADALVTVPWYEPFGIAPLEAMACGLPVVASAVGGLIDTVVDGRTGVHVPPRDPERLASELRALLADRERRMAYGQAGARRARQYDWQRIAGATLDVYAKLAGRRPRRARGRSVGRFALPPSADEHMRALSDALPRMQGQMRHLATLGEHLGAKLLDGARLLAVGNGGSAAQAQHLTAELVGRYQCERRPLSAICLHGDTSSLTAIGNDYGANQAFARQVQAHGRPGDVLLAISTSGRSENVLEAVRAGRAAGLETWGLTGAVPNPLAELCDEVAAFACQSTATVQELHLVAAHVICAATEREVALHGEAAGREEVFK